MLFKLCLVLVLLGLCSVPSTRSFSEDFYNGFNTLVREGRKTVELNNSLQGVHFPHLFRKNYSPKQKSIFGPLLCMTCDVVIDIAIQAVKNNVDDDLIIDAVTFLCIELRIENEEVCNGVININKDTLFYIFRANNTPVTSKRVCSILLQDFNCVDDNPTNWEIDIPPALPPPNQLHVLRKNNKKLSPIKVLQLTDFHYDPNYEVGSNADCDEPLCCQAGSKPATREAAAGYWSDHRLCDLPWHTIINILNHLVIEHHDIDYIYFTGDIISHKVWMTNTSSNTKAITDLLTQMKKTFNNIPVYPILGNHEPHPVNMFSYIGENNHTLSTKWIFELAAEQWMQWLPEETKDTILKGGYYTVKVKEGFRIIALNSNVGYTYNFWLFYNDTDPFGQLQWLADTLLEAEKNNERVHLLSHVPTGDSACLHNWSREFVKIINRFSDIITAQFNGHTHFDDITVFYKPDNITTTSIAFNGGSLTAYPNLNPNYKVYHVDPDSYEVLDYDSWTYNITEANLNPQMLPQWHKMYSFLEKYNISSLTQQSVSTLVEQMALDPNSKLLQTYYRNKYREARLVDDCDYDCELETLCFMVTYVHGHNFHCNKITNTYNSAHSSRQFNNKGIILN